MLFICYAHKDGEFVDLLEADICSLGVEYFRDIKHIIVGDSIPEKIGGAIQSSRGFLLVWSGAARRSWFATEEWLAAFAQQNPSAGSLRILPVILDDTPLPKMLEHRKYADFRGHYKAGWLDLKRALVEHFAERGLRLGGATGAGELLLDRAVKLYRDAYRPFSSVKVSRPSGMLLELLTDVKIENRLDLAIVGISPDDTAELTHMQVADMPALLVVPRGSRLWGREGASWKELRAILDDEQTIMLNRSRSSGTYRETQKYLTKIANEAWAEEVLSRHEEPYESMTIALDAVEEGEGVLIAPKIVVDVRIEAGRLWGVSLPDATRIFHAAWSEKYASNKSRSAFIKMLGEEKSLYP